MASRASEASYEGLTGKGRRTEHFLRPRGGGSAMHNAGPAEQCWTIEPAPHPYGLEHRASSLSQGPFPLARAAFLHSPPTRRMPTSPANRFT